MCSPFESACASNAWSTIKWGRRRGFNPVYGTPLNNDCSAVENEIVGQSSNVVITSHRALSSCEVRWPLFTMSRFQSWSTDEELHASMILFATTGIHASSYVFASRWYICKVVHLSEQDRLSKWRFFQCVLFKSVSARVCEVLISLVLSSSVLMQPAQRNFDGNESLLAYFERNAETPPFKYRCSRGGPGEVCSYVAGLAFGGDCPLGKDQESLSTSKPWSGPFGGLVVASQSSPSVRNLRHFPNVWVT